jgi:hypothetical protein
MAFVKQRKLLEHLDQAERRRGSNSCTSPMLIPSTWATNWAKGVGSFLIRLFLLISSKIDTWFYPTLDRVIK